jgi:hypothetical protein
MKTLYYFRDAVVQRVQSVQEMQDVMLLDRYVQDLARGFLKQTYEFCKSEIIDY